MMPDMGVPMAVFPHYLKNATENKELNILLFFRFCLQIASGKYSFLTRIRLNFDDYTYVFIKVVIILLSFKCDFPHSFSNSSGI
jgi:hypothetical protein